MKAANDVKILLVEDNDTDFFVFQETITHIRDFFVQLERVESLAEASAKLEGDQDDFDIVFLDLHLPDSEGRATFDAVRPLVGRRPIVILSGMSDRLLSLEIVKAGAQDYLVKGEIDSLLLEKAIEYSIERKKNQEIVERSELKYRSTFESVGVAIGEYDYSELYTFIKSKPLEEVIELLDQVSSELDTAIELRSKIKLTSANEAALRLFEQGSLGSLRANLKNIYTQGYTEHIAQFVRCLFHDQDYFEQEMWYRTPQKGMICVLNRVRILGDAFGFHRALISSVNITRLKEQEKQLNELNEELENRVEERTAQLQEAVKELESFSYSVSHDLRAPLRAINGFEKMLHSHIEADLDDKGKRYMDNIGRAAKEMGQLIDDLLNFSRMGRKDLKKSVIDMSLLSETIAQDLKQQVVDRKVEVKVGKLDPCMGDPAMAKQVMVNLIWNSIKYSADKEHSIIELDSEVKGEWVEYCVKDNGMGFDMKYADKLFGVFQRLHQDTDIPGTGAGLAIVQRIIKRHGGDIWAKGDVGKGAQFFFTMPAKLD